ncbi:hypothetical protein BJX66DRAFT_311910 [Aspergillus keveii]|uniref:Uncharacterized protein n=1 Tax=Aspergillus keveii TaxID=714993 RepID=A0ABR4FUS2_9EURO
MDTKSQLQKVAQMKSSANLVLNEMEMDDSHSVVSFPTTVPSHTCPPPRTDIPDYIFNNGMGRFDVALAEEYAYADTSDLKAFEKVWKHLIWWWNWKIKLQAPLTKEEKAQVKECVAGLSDEMIYYRDTTERGRKSAQRNDLFNRIAIVLNWAEGSTGGKLPSS